MTDEAAMTQNDDALRARLEKLLQGGLETEFRERAYTSEAVHEIVTRLGTLAKDDYASKLKVAGFLTEPYSHSGGGDGLSEACETCMYYVIHRHFCSLPELELPVRPHWSCRLWRI